MNTTSLTTAHDEQDDRRPIRKARNRTLYRLHMRREEATARAAIAIMEARAMDAAANALANMMRSELDAIEHAVAKLV